MDASNRKLSLLLCLKTFIISYIEQCTCVCSDVMFKFKLTTATLHNLILVTARLENNTQKNSYDVLMRITDNINCVSDKNSMMCVLEKLSGLILLCFVVHIKRLKYTLSDFKITPYNNESN